MGAAFVVAFLVVGLGFSLLSVEVDSWRPWPQYFNQTVSKTGGLSLEQQSQSAKTGAALVFGASKKNEGSSSLVNMKYHMGPVLTSAINVHVIWYGRWSNKDKRVIKEFLLSISQSKPNDKTPSVAQWWQTVQLYTDQTGANVSRNVVIANEHQDRYSHGKILSRLTVQEVIKNAITAKANPLPVDPKNGLYLLLTSSDVEVQDFCRAVCGFHYFTFPSIVGYTLPYAWVGHAGKQCPDLCAYPFAVPAYMTGMKPFNPPNGDVGIDGMISVIAHELAELSSNPLINAWYAGEDPTSPTEIADLCEGVYGTGGGGSYTGQVLTDKYGGNFNAHGIRRKYLVQWIWSPIMNSCAGPNALD
uniref:TSA: Wollemia nobilis Ref_Wollemi_Transcript_12578_1304 transcribed RNA sequence n=1 Tax=Wollemia nobilis TaxID=56998 RepID=A0A0C9RLA6_9CONI